MSTIRQQGSYLLGLIGLDLVLKIAAFNLLDLNKPVPQCALCLELAVNRLNLGSYGQSIGALYGSHFLLAGAACSFALAIFLAVAATRWKWTVRSVFACLLLATLVFFGVNGLTTLYPIEHISPSQLAIILRIAQTGIWIVVWVYSRTALWKMGALLLSAGGLSNLLSSIYPPYHVVDFLWSTPLNRVTGIGIFNLADAYVLVGSFVVAAALLRTIALATFQRASRASSRRAPGAAKPGN
jgi:lipoprotein signal peptidase